MSGSDRNQNYCSDGVCSYEIDFDARVGLIASLNIYRFLGITLDLGSVSASDYYNSEGYWTEQGYIVEAPIQQSAAYSLGSIWTGGFQRNKFPGQSFGAVESLGNMSISETPIGRDGIGIGIVLSIQYQKIR